MPSRLLRPLSNACEMRCWEALGSGKKARSRVFERAPVGQLQRHCVVIHEGRTRALEPEGPWRGFSLAFVYYLWSGRAVVKPKLRETRLRWPLFRDILRVGLLASLSSIMTNVTIALTNGVVGAFGPAAIAGYGVGTRLEYLLIPLAFGFGGPLVALVGTNLGAGNRDRALRAAWIGGWICFAITEVIGVAAALFPAAWLMLFDRDPAMIAAGSMYLRIVGPFFGFFGLGIRFTCPQRLT